MRATGVTFLCAGGGQMRSGDLRKMCIQVFFYDKKGKPAQSERCKRSGETGVGRGKTCLIPTEGWSRRLGGRLCFRHSGRGGVSGMSGGRGSSKVRQIS